MGEKPEEPKGELNLAEEYKKLYDTSLEMRKKLTDVDKRVEEIEKEYDKRVEEIEKEYDKRVEEILSLLEDYRKLTEDNITYVLNWIKKADESLDKIQKTLENLGKIFKKY